MAIWRRLWEIDDGIEDVPRFLRLLPGLFPSATMFCAEGTRIVPDVAAIYLRHGTPTPNAAPRQILWPPSGRYACQPSAGFYEELAQVATGREPEEVLHHLFLLEGGRRLIEWHDAFANALWLDGELPESTVAALATPFGLHYRR